jgi:hypothetical protein
MCLMALGASAELVQSNYIRGLPTFSTSILLRVLARRLNKRIVPFTLLHTGKATCRREQDSGTSPRKCKEWLAMMACFCGIASTVSGLLALDTRNIVSFSQDCACSN